MASDYLIVSKKILPDYYEKVIETRELLNNHTVETVTEAVKITGISRNTYYKYKDYLFRTEESKNERKAALTLILNHQTGALSDVLSFLSSINASVLTIAQAYPVANKASVSITIDITNLNCLSSMMIEQLKELSSVSSAYLDSVE